MQAIKVYRFTNTIDCSLFACFFFFFTFQIIFTQSCYNATNQKDYSSSTDLIYVQDEGPS